MILEYEGVVKKLGLAGYLYVWIKKSNNEKLMNFIMIKILKCIMILT